MNKIILAALQLELKKTNNLSYLLDELENLCSKSKDIDIVVLTELAVGGAGAKNCQHPLSKYEKTFSDLAKKYSIFLVPGTFYEETSEGIFNVAPVFNREGALISKAIKSALLFISIEPIFLSRPKHLAPPIVEIDNIFSFKFSTFNFFEFKYKKLISFTKFKSLLLERPSVPKPVEW